ncbi:MAG: hypothetical protein L7S72_05190 [Flavobacteriales bacterium]|nr:hypothetical protein [Flavobacteriales bacterium]
MSKKENKYWIYSYQQGCGPCRRTTPIVDTIIATGVGNIRKIVFDDAPLPFKKFGTPAIALWDEDEQKIISKVFTGSFWAGYMDLYDNHPYLLTTEISPVEFLVKIVQSTKDPSELFKTN